MKEAEPGLKSHTGHAFGDVSCTQEISWLLQTVTANQLGDPKPSELFKPSGCNKTNIDVINVSPRLKAFPRRWEIRHKTALDPWEAQLGMFESGV